MFVFDPIYLLFLIFLSSFVPGALLALAIFRKSDLNLFEKIITGFAIGFAGPGIFSYLAFLVGINYSYAVAIVSVIIFYIIAISAFIYNKAYEDIKLPATLNKEEIPYLATMFFLALILLLTFLIRLPTYSPVFQELDPYYYIYHPYELLTKGYAPLNDGTAWYPEVQVSHRGQAPLAYMEANWYSLYTQGQGEYSNYLLAAIAGLYPPLAAMFAVFFLYLFLSSQYRKEFAVIAAAIAAFLPIFIIKLTAGESEVQPYAFFSIAFFLAFYALAVKMKDIRYALVAAFAYLLLTMGSSSGIVAMGVLLVFVPLHSLYLFFTNNQKLKEFMIMNWIIAAGGLLIALLSAWYGEYLSFTFFMSPVFLIPFVLTVFATFLYFLMERVPDLEMRLYAVIALAIIGLIVVAFTPLSDYLFSPIHSGLGLAQYTVPLQRTIAEQGLSGEAFEDQLGFVAALPNTMAYDLLHQGPESPIVAIFAMMLLPFSAAMNALLALFTWLLTTIFGGMLNYTPKADSLFLTFLFAMLLAVLYSMRRLKDGENLSLLLAAIIFPIVYIGILKAKYTIYTAFFFTYGIGLLLGETFLFGNALLASYYKEEEKRKRMQSYLFIALITFGSFVVFFEAFGSHGYAGILLNVLGVERFQDNPAVVGQKMKALCQQLQLKGQYDPDVCAAGDDPVGYASKGINHQFNSKLCMLSILDDVNKPSPARRSIAPFVCQRISEYWIDSMEWIRDKTEPDARITSWWDYGHWINFFGMRNTVLRNEHASLNMIGNVAYLYTEGTPEELLSFMKTHDSTYALFDSEIVISGGVFGAKYHALNYLGCSWINRTTVAYSPGTSYCEIEHTWEQVFVPTNPLPQELCNVSANKTGRIAYKPIYSEIANGRYSVSIKPYYCVADTTLANGQKTTATYYLDQTDNDGNLKLNKGFMKYDYVVNDGKLNAYTLVYTKDLLWMENGTAVSGWSDRKGKFYDSLIYRAFILEDLPGFKLVYKTPDGNVKIYKIAE